MKRRAEALVLDDDMVARRIVMRRAVWDQLVTLAEAVTASKGIEVSPTEVAVIALEAGLAEVKPKAAPPLVVKDTYATLHDRAGSVVRAQRTGRHDLTECGAASSGGLRCWRLAGGCNGHHSWVYSEAEHQQTLAPVGKGPCANCGGEHESCAEAPLPFRLGQTVQAFDTPSGTWARAKVTERLREDGEVLIEVQFEDGGRKSLLRQGGVRSLPERKKRRGK